MSEVPSEIHDDRADVLALRVGRVDLRSRTVSTFHGHAVALTPRECALLARLARTPNVVVTCEALLADVWGRRWSGEPEQLGVVRNAVFRLRQKVEVDITRPDHLQTAQGEGYVFVSRVEERRFDIATSSPEAPGEPWSATWDVGREAEEASALGVLERPHRPLVLLGSWRVGKTWFLRRLMRRLDPEDRVVWLDPRAVEREVLNDPLRLQYLLAHLFGEAAGLSEEVIERAWQGPGTPLLRLRRLLDRDVLPTLRGRLLLVIEDADRLARFPIYNDLFAVLRAWVEDERPVWSRLRVILSTGLSPVRLTARLDSSPFNIGSVVSLGPLSQLALSELAMRYGVVEAKDLGLALSERAGGHPYLARALLYAAATRGEAGLNAEDALAPVRTELRSKLSGVAGLDAALAAARRAPELALPPNQLDELLRLGLIADEHPPYRPGPPALDRMLTP